MYDDDDDDDDYYDTLTKWYSLLSECYVMLIKNRTPYH